MDQNRHISQRSIINQIDHLCSVSLSHLVVTPNVMLGTAGSREASCRLGAGPLVLVPPALWARYWLSSLDVTRPDFTASRFRDTKSGTSGR